MSLLINSFTDSKLVWINDPAQWGVIDETGETEGSQGSYIITQNEMKITAPAKKDFWSKTFYTPVLKKSDACAFVCEIPIEVFMQLAIILTASFWFI